MFTHRGLKCPFTLAVFTKPRTEHHATAPSICDHVVIINFSKDTAEQNVSTQSYQQYSGFVSKTHVLWSTKRVKITTKSSYLQSDDQLRLLKSSIVNNIQTLNCVCRPNRAWLFHLNFPVVPQWVNSKQGLTATVKTRL